MDPPVIRRKIPTIMSSTKTVPIHLRSNSNSGMLLSRVPSTGKLLETITYPLPSPMPSNSRSRRRFTNNLKLNLNSPLEHMARVPTRKFLLELPLNRRILATTTRVVTATTTSISISSHQATMFPTNLRTCIAKLADLHKCHCHKNPHNRHPRQTGYRHLQ